MATGTQSTPASTTSSASSQGERLVEQRIATARRQLRLVDLASSVALLAICLLGYFFLLALIEHWLAPLGSVTRYAAWGAMLLAGGYFLVTRVVPAVFRPINPVFAAKTIEEGDPSLKNSLINFLLFRHRRDDLRPVVYQALQQQAAEGAARISPEAVVDRSGLIKLGYVLAASLALFALYEIASPKAALQTVQRVMLPWAAIDPPTRVTISEVTPGNTQAYRGFPVEVTAEVRGLRDEEPVTLLYSTADGQIVDRTIRMEPAGSVGYEYHGSLPEEGGLTQNVHYHLSAGDALSPEYSIEALTEPTVVIRRVEYHPPVYTGRQPSVAEDNGDLKGLEQTLVTLHAEANYPLASAVIELDPDTAARPKRRKLQVEGKQVTGSFRLELNADRKTAKYSSYQLRIVTADEVSNAQPIMHTIEVVPDLAPEVEILTPEARRVELPQDGSLTIEARAIDPDFGLAALQLQATHAGKSLLKESLLAEGTQPRQQRGEYRFQPGKLQLPVGAEVVYWAQAADNRTAEPAGSPTPNTAQTQQYRIRITPPENPDQKQSNESAAGDNGGQPNEAGGQDNAPGNESNPGDQGEAGSEAGDQGSEGGADGNEGESGEGESEAGGEQEGGRDGESQQEGELGEGSGDERAGHGSNPNGPEGADQQGSGGNQSMGEGGTKPGDQTGGSQGESGGQQPGAGSQSSGEQGGQGEQTDSPQQGGGDNSRPLSADGSEDADAFERIEEFLQEQQADQQGEAGGSKQNQGETSDAESAGEQQASPDAQPQAGNPADSEGGAGEKPNQSPRQDDGGKREPTDSQASDQTKPGDPKQTTAENPGGAPQGADDQRPEESAAENGAEQEGDRNGGRGTTGDSGAGKPRGSDSEGAPEAQEANRDTPKNRQDSGQGDKPNEEAQSPSVSKKQSDSEGEQGNRSGGGGEGGGQAAKQPGNDSPGSNTAADEGAGAASEPGEGEAGSQAGEGKTAEGETGQSGEQSGAGSRNQAGEQGAQPGEGQTTNQQPGEAGSQQADPTNTGGQAPTSPQGNSPNRAGGGAPGRAGSEDREFADDAVPPADEVNLEHARKATNLVLEKLKEQGNQPDQELLDRLGWSPEQLQQFVDRWQTMKQQAGQPGNAGEAARQELDEALQSLGLTPEAARKIESADDQLGGARDAGFRSQPPSQYQRLYDAFRKSGG